MAKPGLADLRTAVSMTSSQDTMQSPLRTGMHSRNQVGLLVVFRLIARVNYGVVALG